MSVLRPKPPVQPRSSPAFPALTAPAFRTKLVGWAPFQICTANVITALTPNVGLTAEPPGSTTIFASVSGLNSPGLPYETCRVVSISVHSATTSDTSFTLTSGGTPALTADGL